MPADRHQPGRQHRQDGRDRQGRRRIDERVIGWIGRPDADEAVEVDGLAQPEMQAGLEVQVEVAQGVPLEERQVDQDRAGDRHRRQDDDRLGAVDGWRPRPARPAADGTAQVGTNGQPQWPGQLHAEPPATIEMPATTVAAQPRIVVRVIGVPAAGRLGLRTAELAARASRRTRPAPRRDPRYGRPCPAATPRSREPSSKLESSEWRIARLVRARARGALVARAAAMPAVSVGQLLARHDSIDEADPERLARPGSDRAGASARIARPSPTRRGRSQVAPLSGIRPIRPKASTKVAVAAAIRRSQAKASEAPAPAATPLIEAMTGLSRVDDGPDQRIEPFADLDIERRRDSARAAP